MLRWMVLVVVYGCFGVAVVYLAGCGFGGWRGAVFWGMVGVFLVVMWFSGVGVFVLYASGFGFEGGWCFGVYLWVLGVLAVFGCFLIGFWWVGFVVVLLVVRWSCCVCLGGVGAL